MPPPGWAEEPSHEDRAFPPAPLPNPPPRVPPPPAPSERGRPRPKTTASGLSTVFGVGRRRPSPVRGGRAGGTHGGGDGGGGGRRKGSVVSSEPSAHPGGGKPLPYFKFAPMGRGTDGRPLVRRPASDDFVSRLRASRGAAAGRTRRRPTRAPGGAGRGGRASESPAPARPRRLPCWWSSPSRCRGGRRRA